jgi:hypothetical protein
MTKLSTSILTGLLTAVSVASFAQTPTVPVGAAGGTQWKEAHPRRAEVNARLNNQNKRIKTEVAEGDMSKATAAKLHKKDRQIRQEERDMAAQNGGHITKQEQKTLNQQENVVSKTIGK